MIASLRPRIRGRLAVVTLALIASGACADRDVTAPPARAKALPHGRLSIVGGVWSTVAPMPTARLASAGDVINGQLYVVGGIPGGGSTNANESYDPALDTWTTRAAAPSSRGVAGARTINNLLYVVGGWNAGNAGATNGALEIYDPSADAWTSGPPMPTPRGGVATAVINGKLYVAGGDGFGTDYATLEIYDPATNSWTTGPSMPTVRQAPAGEAINGIFYVLGGIVNGGQTFATLEAYDPVTNAWTTRTPIPTAQRFFLSTTVIGGELVVFGGQDASGNLVNTVESYDPETDSWTSSSAMPTGREAATVGVINGAIFVVGGQSAAGSIATNESFAALETPNPLGLPSITPMVEAGLDHTCVVNAYGAVLCWGRNDHGESTIPAGLGTVAQVSAGGYFTCVLNTAGSVTCWGNNDYGQIAVPGGLSTVAQISTGADHGCALRTDRTVACWGALGQFGQASVPAGLSGVSQVSAGGYHTCALKYDRTVVCWGRNSEGESTVPAGLGSVKQIAAGNVHTCALKTDGVVVCWGGNNGYDFGQTTVPAGLGATVQISARDGAYHTCALKPNASIACWGYDGYGEVTVPASVGSVQQIAAGSWDTCAIQTSGAVVCWGQDPFGQIDVPAGINVNQPFPFQTPAGTNVAVTPVDQTTNAPGPAGLTFATVTAGGTTTVTSSLLGVGGSPPSPSGFQVGSPGTYYDIQTTAMFSGSVAMCISYAGVSFSDESALRLLHYTNGAWSDVTTTLDTGNDTICGVTTSFSPFLVAQAMPTSPMLTALAPANIWLGLKNSDDVGTKFDLLAEVLMNGMVVGSGQVNDVPGGSSGFNNAVQRTITLALPSSVQAQHGGTMSLRLSVRIAATGHRSGTARLWFNDAAANTRFGATISGSAVTYYAVGTTAPSYTLRAGTAGSGPKATVDVTVDRAVGGNAFKPFGTWSIQLP